MKEFFYLGGDCPDVHVVSGDGLVWTKQNIEEKIIRGGMPGSWDEVVSSPTALVDGGKIQMWYSGARAMSLSEFILGVGLAEHTPKL